jgi:two-component sensor histidine kinase
MTTAKRSGQEHEKFNEVRVEIWKLASQWSLSEEELIQQLLDKVGPAIGVSRACYNACRGDKVVCELEWCGESVAPSIGTNLPSAIVGHFVRDGSRELSRDTALERIPKQLHAIAAPVVMRFARSLNLESVYLLPFYVQEQWEGVLTFDVCADAPTKIEWTEERKSLAEDALQIVAQAILQNRMQRELREAKADLENRVRERTCELIEANQKVAASLREKEMLLTEVRHRVKNNLQIIDSLLSLQAANVGDKRSRAILGESRDRVRSMALIHETLFRRGKDETKLDFKDYVQRLVQSLMRAYGVDASRISLRLNIEDVDIGADEAVLCGLIVNELVSNALKHAFGKKKGHITIGLTRDGNGLYDLIVRDNGVGLPDNTSLSGGKSLGLNLVGALCDQLGAECTLTRQKGTRVRITFRR